MRNSSPKGDRLVIYGVERIINLPIKEAGLGFVYHAITQLNIKTNVKFFTIVASRLWRCIH